MAAADRLLSAAVRVMPAGRREWGRAMQAELAAIDEPAERWSFAWGCLRASHLLRGVLHLLVVLATLGALLAWIATVDYPPMFWILSGVATALAAVCWQGRRAGLLGPTGDSAAAWLLRTGGYLVAAAIIAVSVAHAHPADGLLALFAVAGSFLIGLASVGAWRVVITGLGSAVAATVVWLVVVLAAPPIPPTVGLALAVTAGAAVVAVLANAGSARGSLLAGLLAVAGALLLIFLTVGVLASYGADRLIPDITPGALPGQHISESRVEIVDPYVVVMVFSALAATALGLAAVVTRRPVPGGQRASR